MSDIPLWDALRAIIPEIRWIETFRLPEYTTSSAFGTAGRVFLNQFVVKHPLIIDRLCYQVGLASAGNVRLGVYREGATPESPDGGEVVVESASVAQEAITYFQLVTIAEIHLERGKYFLGIQGDDVTGTFWTVRSPDGDPCLRYYDHGYGAFTDPCSATAPISNSIDGTVRVARVLRP